MTRSHRTYPWLIQGGGEEAGQKMHVDSHEKIINILVLSCESCGFKIMVIFVIRRICYRYTVKNQCNTQWQVKNLES